MELEDLKYSLRPENVAGEPHEVRLGCRDLGRMLIIDRKHRTQAHSFVDSLPGCLEPGDVLVLNDSKRIPGVLRVRTVSEDAQVELRFAHLEGEYVGVCRAYPLHFVKTGTVFRSANHGIIRILETSVGDHQLCRVQSDGSPLTVILKEGGLPITSFFYRSYWKLENYNNFYANEEGSFESPMAGLHFTPQLLDAIRVRGVTICCVTLHVAGSWLPILKGKSSKRCLPEKYVVPKETAEAVNEAKRRGARVLACGSTAVKALETVANADGTIRSESGETALYISPGHSFRVPDMYFTNFHPSSSSLMLLDAAFCEADLLLKSYEVARDAGYLFFEFGDAVLYV